MPFLITPTTELEAVNECLANIGQAPVSDILGDNLGVDVETARATVRKVLREVQTVGYHWNTEKDWPLIPSASGDIILPPNTLSVDSTDQWGYDVVQRGNRLYDRDNRSYTFTETVYVTLTLGLPFEETPEAVRRYVTMRAARLFQERLEGTTSQSDSEDEMRALSVLHADQLRIEDNNILSGSASMVGLLRRHSR